MSYDIDASLENGEPRLHIIDADSGAVRLAWHYRKKDLDETKHIQTYLEEVAVKELFRELFLLSCSRKVKVDKGNSNH